MRPSYQILAFALMLLVTACAAPASRPTDLGAQPRTSPSAPHERKAIEILIRGGPNAFITEVGGLSGPTARPSRYFHEFVNAYVTTRDHDDEVAPHLAAALPSLDDGTWKLLPDGGMEVTWKLRPGVKWQDGKDLTSDDVRFSWEVASDPLTLVGAPTIARFVDRVDTPNAQTFVMHWKETNQLGGELGERQFDVFPRHVLEESYRADPAGFSNHPYLTNPDAFVGSGAYRPLEWERESYVVVEAWDGYFLGRPKIDRVTFRVIPDSRTALANLLSDAADASYLALEYPESRILEREWLASGKGSVQLSPSAAQYLLPQFKAELTTPPDLLNPQVRRALMHAMNRQDITDALDLGPGMVADSTTLSGTAIGDAVARDVVRYPYDPARATALLAEAGWKLGADGMLIKDGRRFEVEFRAPPGSATAVVFPVIEQQYHAVGVTLTLQHYLPANIEEQVTYPGLLAIGLPTNNLVFAQRWHSRFIAGPQTHYAGANLMGYAEPKTDAAIDRLLMAVRREDQLRYWGEAWRRITEDAAILPMYYQVDSYAARKGLVGLQPRNPLGGAAYQIHLWEAP